MIIFVTSYERKEQDNNRQVRIAVRHADARFVCRQAVPVRLADGARA